MVILPVPRHEDPRYQLDGWQLGESFRDLLKQELTIKQNEVAAGILNGLPETYSAYREEVGKYQSLADTIDGIDEIWQHFSRGDDAG